MKHTIVSKFQELWHHPKRGEYKLVVLSSSFFFCLLCAYFILRPLRDEMGIENGAVNMQWLFTGTFLAMVCLVPIFGFLVSKNSIKNLMIYVYTFFLANLLVFYYFFETHGPSRILAIIFFIWLSVFNLFIVSLFWSFMADVFHSLAAKKFFGIIAAGGSLGALTGPAIARGLSGWASFATLLLAGCFFLGVGLCCVLWILKLSPHKNHFKQEKQNFKGSASAIFEGVQQITKSSYLMGIVGFILLYTSISTILYFQQAHLVEQTLLESTERIRYFSNIDLTVNGIAIFGQFFLTARIIRRIGLSFVLASIPFVMGLGLVFLGFHPALGIVAMLMVLHRAGNFTLLRPGREILFTVTSTSEKYKAKNCIDTAVYRGGDALVGWAFSGLVALGWGLGAIAFLAIPLAFLWSFLGFKLGNQHLEKENIVPLKQILYENKIQS
jgi:AAA family ATP:ADP antiporter